jgi:hypothetical protein
VGLDQQASRHNKRDMANADGTTAAVHRLHET